MATNPRQVNSSTDAYMSRLVKLIPSEVSVVYLAINSLVPLSDGFSLTMMGALVALTILCPIYLWVLQNVKSWLQIAFTTFSFPLWALNISIGRSDYLNATALGVVLILVTLVIPLLPTHRQ